MTIAQSIASRIMQSRLGEEIRKTLTVKENDNTFYIGDHASGLYRDRFDYDRATVLSECLRAWRVSPVARRIVLIYTEFIVGSGLEVASKHKASDKFLKNWWSHPLNNFNEQIPNWADERTRTGNLFFLVTVMADGMSFVRAVPVEMIADIQTAPNDVYQETYYLPANKEMPPWVAYDRMNPIPEPISDSTGATPSTWSFMLHYAVNRPVGVSWGEPDLAPMLPWIGRFSTWLEDRVRLNHYRSVFMYILQGQFKNEQEKKAKQASVNANPPKSGSILVTDPSEQWGIMSANLDAFDASVDGLAIKKMIAIGAGLPPHYLAEPESSTTTTAEAAGTPTFRGLEQMQTTFVAMLKDMAQIALTIRKEYDNRVKADAEVKITAPDITERDNSNLALAAARIEPIFADLFDREMIDANEMMRMTYRMAGENYEAKPALKGIRVPPKTKGNANSEDTTPPTDPGELKEVLPSE